MRQGKDDRAGLLRRLARRQRERPRPDVVREGGANSGAIRNAAPFRCLNARYERMVDGVGASKARRFGLELQRDLDLLCFGHGVPRIAGALLPGTIRLPDRGVATLPRRLEAQDLRGVELIGRRRMLVKALKKAGPALRFSEHMESGDGEAMFRHACALGLEGIVSKRVASRYKSGSEFFLRIVTPSGLEFGWPVTKGSIGYKVAEEIVALAEPAPKGSKRAKRDDTKS